MSKTQSMAQTARPFASENVFAPLYRRFLSALLDRMRFGRLAITLPEGGVLTGHGLEGLDVQAGIRLRSYRAVRRMVIGGDIGFAESYVDGDWDSPDLANLLFVAARNQSALEREIFGNDGIAFLEPIQAPVPVQQPSRQSAEHRRALRSGQRLLRRMAGRQHDLFFGVVRIRFPSACWSPACEVRPPVRSCRHRSGRSRARNRVWLGRLCRGRGS